MYPQLFPKPGDQSHAAARVLSGSGILQPEDQSTLIIPIVVVWTLNKSFI